MVTSISWSVPAPERSASTWGSPEGLDLKSAADVPVADNGSEPPLDPYYEREPDEAFADARPLVQVVGIGDVPHIFVARLESFALIPVHADRSFGAPLELECQRPMSVALGDFNGDGHQDLVVASRQADDNGECSWVYWGASDGYGDGHKSWLPSLRACDVAVGDLDGNGYDDIVLCQNRTMEMYTTESLVYRGGPQGHRPRPRPAYR